MFSKALVVVPKAFIVYLPQILTHLVKLTNSADSLESKCLVVDCLSAVISAAGNEVRVHCSRN